MKKPPRFPLIPASLVGFALLCQVSPGFSRLALDRLSRPAMALLHRLTAPVSFPVAEVAALALAGWAALSLAASLLWAIARRSAAPLIGWLRGLARAALALAGLLALLWAPARALPVESLPGPDDARLATLCGVLIDDLNASPLAFPTPGDALKAAPAAAGMAQGAAKAARYPEWMRAAQVCGLFVPLTGEALVDADAPAPLVPFTAVHELAHLAGIADEGAANIAAWQRCMEAGATFADSARLWALRYAMGMLRQRDADAWRQMSAKMEDATTRVFRMCGGECHPPLRRAGGLPWPGLARGDYTALVAFLARAIP